jgi:hypothetical protein
MSPDSVSSYVQAAEYTAPPKQDPRQSVRERDQERNVVEKVESDPGEGRGVKIDFRT